jgi:hypothetical protein
MITVYNVVILIFLLASALLFYAFKPLLKGFVKFKATGESGKLALCILGLLIVTPLALATLYSWFIFLLTTPIYLHYSFDKDEWRTNIDQRYKMADDLIDSEKVLGLTESQVIELLGKPTNKYDNTIRYYIGDRPTPGLDLDPDELVLDLKDGKVVKSYLHET